MDIAVAGQGSRTLPPEFVALQLQITFEGPVKAEAVAATSAAAREIDDVIAGLGDAVTESHVDPLQTSYWTPTSSTGEVMPPQWSASISMRLQFPGTDGLATFVAEAGARPGVRIDHVQWRLTDATRRRLESEALQDAVRDARSRAQLVADAAGAGPVEYVAVSDPGLSGSGPEPRPMFARAAMDSAGPEARPADIEVTASVHARFTA